MDPSAGDAGFTPHRDRQPADVPASFGPGGEPRFATAWLPLTDASPDNSCLYFIPAAHDPGYRLGDGAEGDALQLCLATPEAVQSIRAVPCAAGGAVAFSHRVFHWGSKGRPACRKPRVAISFGGGDPAFEPHRLAAGTAAAGWAAAGAPFPSLAQRLALAAAQCVAYQDRFTALSPAQLKLFHQLMTASDAEGPLLAPAFARQIAPDFAAAAHRALDAATAVAAARPGDAAAAAAVEMAEGVVDTALDAVLDFAPDFADDFDEGPEGGAAGPAGSDDVSDEASDEEEEAAEEEEEPVSDAFWAAAAAAAAQGGVGGAGWEAALGDEEGAEVRRAKRRRQVL